jgi:hypothetical protein
MAVPGAGVKSNPIVSAKSISAVGVVVDMVFENKGTGIAVVLNKLPFAMLITILTALLYLAIIVVVVYVIIWVLGLLGVVIPGNILKAVWAIIIILALIWLITHFAGDINLAPRHYR